MAKLVKKKKKKGLGGLRGQSAGGSSVETSSLRPEYIPKEAPCRNNCPSGNKIREIITTIGQTEGAERTPHESFEKAWHLLSETSPFPSVCGRVCPHPCEDDCNREHKDGAVGINSIERFIGDYAIEHNFQFERLTDEKHTEKVAIIGAGPAGLSCAYQLARRGYSVTVFEAFSKPGGMLRYGIPEYRLPTEILDKEIKRIEDFGVEIKCDQIIGKDIAYEKIQEDFNAIFVGIGAHKGKLLGIPNEDATNVYTGTEFLNRINSGEKIEVGNNVLVIGGGDTAIDAARVSKRLGADVTVVYRRTKNEMPAIKEEIVGAEEEGVKLEFLAAPIEFEKNGELITKMKCQKMELGEPDDSGRRRPVPIADDFFYIDASTVIAAISQEPDFEGMENLHEGKDWVKIKEDGSTDVDKTYAGGDAIELGLATIAISQGRMAAETIHNKFRGIEPESEEKKPLISHDKLILDYYESKLRNEPFEMPPVERLKELGLEINSTMTEEQVINEA
ncbi:MAG: FAD-dependent oxidoreductase, partial [Ignavibacteria bacterium]|nr:FAD-dependent oxidoreductase [Ignavibacteria bacterium]